MLEEFPKNLETPIDAPFLRKVVRRKRQNDNKRLKLLEDSASKKVEIVEAQQVKIEKQEKEKDKDVNKETKEVKETKEKKKKREPVQMNLALPTKSRQFREIIFKMDDFERKTTKETEKNGATTDVKQ